MSDKRDSTFQQWFFLRLVVATLVVSAGVILLSLTADNVPQRALLLVLAIQYLSLVGGYIALRRGAPRVQIQTAEIILDVILITICVHLTGGVGSAFTLLYFFPILLASSTRPHRGAMATAILSSLTLLVYEILVATGVTLPVPIYFHRSVGHSPELLQVQFAVGLFLIIGYLAGELARKVDQKAHLLADKREELARHRLEVQGILDNMSSGVLTLDEQGRVLRMNPAAGNILGVDTQRIQGRSLEESLGSVMPSFVSYLREALREGNSIQRVELNILRKDTKVVPIGVSISPQFDEEGSHSGIIAVFQDLTEVLRMRERMRASDRLAAVGELSAGIAHEIRNPLASIRGSVEMLAGELAVEGENRRLMDLIQKESDRLNRIIEDFLEFARLRPQSPKRNHLGELLEELCTMLRQRDDLGAATRIELVAAPADLIVDVDDEQMTQVFLNLSLNAIQAMEGSGTLAIVSTAECIGARWEAVVRFMDEGPGIDEEFMEHLFDPFFTTKSNGTGLGLSMANRIVHNHQGRIEVRMRVVGGAEFSVHLPLTGVWKDGRLAEEPDDWGAIPDGMTSVLV